MSSTNTKRNHLIELLRFLSASWVVIFHFNKPLEGVHNWYRNFCEHGYLGVPIFFIISGYCICIAQQHAKTPNEFIIRRLFRIFPPYWFSLLVVLGCVVILKIINGTNSIPMPKQVDHLLATIVLYTKPLSNYQTINWVYWTLPFEVFFYVIIYLTLTIKGKLNLLFPLALTAISLFIPVQTVGWLFFMNELPLFMLGYSLYLLLNRQANPYQTLPLFMISALGIYIKHPSSYHLLTAAIVTVLILADSKLHLKENFFSRLGDFSYSVYLIHGPIGIYLFGFVKEMPVINNNILFNITADMALLAFISVLALLMYKFVELPSIKHGRKVASKY